MDSKTNKSSANKASRIARSVAGHISGGKCKCSAYSDHECGCPNVDWRTKQEIAATEALRYCLDTLKTYHMSKPGIAETIRNTEEIRDAGNYKPNTIGTKSINPPQV